jgi:hypothetical protein
LAVSVVVGCWSVLPTPTPTPMPTPGDTYAVGDTVWLDRNSDGLQDPDEPGVRDVRVRLTDPAGTSVNHTDGTPVEPVSTDLDGRYVFDLLAPGDYRVVFDGLPDGYRFTTRGSGFDPETDSDPDPATGITGTFTLGPVGPTLPQMEPLSPNGTYRAVAIDSSIDAGVCR